MVRLSPPPVFGIYVNIALCRPHQEAQDVIVTGDFDSVRIISSPIYLLEHTDGFWYIKVVVLTTPSTVILRLRGNYSATMGA